MMNKFFNYAFIGAIALTGATMFAGCSSTDDATAEDTSNPNYNPQTKEVTTQFVLNVAANTGSNVTRQSAATVQKADNFRGLKDAKLIGLSTNKASTFLAPYNGEATTGFTVNKTYELGTLYAENSISNPNNQTSDSRRVLELSLPLTTDAMLVYARAIPANPTTDVENGKVTATIAANPENTTFDLVPRIQENASRYEQTYKLSALILNRIMLSQVNERASTYEHKGVVQEGVLPAISWRGLGKKYKDGEALAPLQEILGRAYSTLVTFGTGEVRAGSASAICSMAFNIRKVMESVLGATATNDDELNAQRLAEEIDDRIAYYFNDTDTESGTKFRSIGDAQNDKTIVFSLVNKEHFLTEAEYTSNYGQVRHEELLGFPTSFKLPLGVAQLYFTDYSDVTSTSFSGGFSYKNPSTSLIDLNSNLAANYYTYPSELLYFDNSLLRVNDNVKVAADYPNGTNPWDKESSWTDWTTGKVTSTTRSVAVKNNINYGVAMLQTKVELAAGVTSFNDNRNAIISTEENQKLTVDDVEKLQLVGVLIGGQNHQLGWNYLAKADGTDDWKYVVYDNSIAGTGKIPTTSGQENYTLLFDNYHVGDQTTQTDVLVALEFVNNAKDFYGKGNMVRQGGTFYLVGKLELGDKRIAAEDWDEYYAIPPYDATGASQKITRIFTQDYMTTATFKIGANSLQNAFITVPDLRSTQTSLGLSVDLQWKPGLVFENVVLGQ